MNNKREQFKKAVWGALFFNTVPTVADMSNFSITIGRVMQALKNRLRDNNNFLASFNVDVEKFEILKTSCKLIDCDEFPGFKVRSESEEVIDWKLTKKNGQECTDDDQADETIEELLQLLK